MKSLTDLQKNTCVATVNIFETGEVSGDYSNVTSVEGDPGGLTYGKSQTTLMSGNLHTLIESYCLTPGVKFANNLRPYLPQLKNRDRSLNYDETLHEILELAGLEPLMQQVQDRFFDHAYWIRRTRSQIKAAGGLWDKSFEIYPHLGGRPNLTESLLFCSCLNICHFSKLKKPYNVFFTGMRGDTPQLIGI
jgi:hypothetical protein